jgi:NADPH2:quinone reductase
VDLSFQYTLSEGVFTQFFNFNHEDLILLSNLLKQGKIKPIVAARMPRNQAAQAHALLASGSVRDKIVLICND